MNESRRWLWLAIFFFLVACGPATAERDVADEAPTSQNASSAEEATATALVALPTATEEAEESPTREASMTPASDPTETAAAPTATIAVAEQPTAASVEQAQEDPYAEYEIVTLLPRDAIPAIDDPEFMEVEEADTFYDPDEFVMGVNFNGDARAYSVGLLSSHEIVNDTVGGVKIAVTW